MESCGYKRPLKSALLVQGKSLTYTLVTFPERLGHVPIKNISRLWKCLCEYCRIVFRRPVGLRVRIGRVILAR